MFRVLIVDDTAFIHSFVKSLAAKYEGFEFVSAENGAHGLDAIKNATRPFDLILLDWDMPVLNGPDTYEAIKKMGVRATVVMMTAKNKPEEIRFMLEAGVAEYLMKPFTLDILVEKIEMATGRTFRNVA